MPCLRIGTQLSENLIDVCLQALRTFQCSLGLRLERANLPLPTETKAERCIEDGEGVEGKL
jgi:hypothetical protein